jgi:FkbM family methyltransferase
VEGPVVIRLLGAASAGARRIGLGSAARWAALAVDAVLLRLRLPPLTAQVDGVAVRGFLRHRSFLAEVVRPRQTYAELFQSLLRPGMTVVDGGAHVGLYTVLAVRGVGPAGFVVAVEPDLYNLAALRVNVERAGATNVEVVAEALAEGAGTARFYETRSTIGSSLIERADARVRVVRTTSIDLLLRGRHVDALLVKLNVEGAEPRALAGIREVLARVEPVAILLEVNPPLLTAAGEDVGALVDGLRAQGFVVEYVDLTSQTGLPLPTPLPKGHLVATRGLTPAFHGELNDQLSGLGRPLLGKPPPGRAGTDHAERPVITAPEEHVRTRDVERRGDDDN